MEPKKITPSRQKKEQIVAKLSDKVAKAKGLIFTNYQGLNHKQLENLKKKLKAANAELVVTKNTLLKLALQKVSNVSPSDTFDTSKPLDTFKDPTATLFLYGDPSEPLKQLAQIIKQFSLPSIKFGILEKQTLDSSQVLKLASLPSREVLLIQLLGQMQGPIYGLHRALRWNIQHFVITLKAIGSTKNS